MNSARDPSGSPAGTRYSSQRAAFSAAIRPPEMPPTIEEMARTWSQMDSSERVFGSPSCEPTSREAVDRNEARKPLRNRLATDL